MTIYGARVTKVYKQEQKWHVDWTSLKEDFETGDMVESRKSLVSALPRAGELLIKK